MPTVGLAWKVSQSMNFSSNFWKFVTEQFFTWQVLFSWKVGLFTSIFHKSVEKKLLLSHHFTQFWVMWRQWSSFLLTQARVWVRTWWFVVLWNLTESKAEGRSVQGEPIHQLWSDTETGELTERTDTQTHTHSTQLHTEAWSKKHWLFTEDT